MHFARIACNLPRTYQSHLLKLCSFHFFIQGIFACGVSICCGQHEQTNSDIHDKHEGQMWPTCALSSLLTKEGI